MFQIVSMQEFLSLPLIIDVRSPSEYCHSHIPNALNFPVLDNAQYQHIGTLYKQNAFNAKILGASMVCANIAKHLLELKGFITPSMPFGIYCARGGMRSQSFGLVLGNIGYQVALLKGGYKSYRKEVTQSLETSPKHRFLTLIGQTGSGKSELIEAFSDSLNIEKLAKHLGSSFGNICGTQPSTKSFQNTLFTRLRELENAPFVLVEGESKRLGNLILPSKLYLAYQKAPKILITSPLQERIQRILQQYGNISETLFYQAMQKIAPFMKKEFWEDAKEAFAKGDLPKVAEILLLEYYDKVYKKESYHHTLTFKNTHDTLQEICEISKIYYP
ncbi:tRNA 2-selenouridine(34) synthase MnmH [Helicobacter mesocricetorum]|uniref:tRNA 2-selenouridine(34) synthase MnmH n=1 Tax=Helicobacter mesocricetorum TaxID=87012 RepID=UPI000CF080C6|nr:tRNA 2-selenouridine(34) synthase MnmH [Helicobacter mesocricetorum]